MKKILLIFSLFTFHSSLCANVVSRIEVIGNQRMDAESVRLLAGVRVGDNPDSNAINQIVKQLQASSLFSDVSVSQNGALLQIKVAEAPTIAMVTTEGNDEISTDDLKKEIRTAARGTYDESVIGGDVQRILALYQRKGIFGTTVNPQKINTDDGRVNVVFEIAEGHPTYIDSIDFTGNHAFRASTLRDAILSREYAWWKFMASFDVYDEDRIKYDQQMLGQFYLRNGYADVKIKSAAGSFTHDRKWYSVVFDLEEGPRYKFGQVSIDNPFPDIDDDDLQDAVAFDAGDIYNVDLIEKTISNLRGAVAEKGYAFINVEPVPVKNDSDRTIGIKFNIAKTNRVYLNSINILGNVRTFDSVIEMQTPMRSGDPFSLQTIEEGRQRMMRTRFFKSVDMVPTRVAGTDLMNLDIKVEEQPTGELSGGLGWSNINGFMIDAGITESNFMGRGQIVQIKGSIAQYQKQALFSFTEPYLFGRALSGGFDISYTMYNYSRLGSYGYDRDSLSIGGRLGWAWSDHWSQSLRLSAAYDQNYDIHKGWVNANLYTLGTNFRYYNLNTDFQQNTHTGIVANFGAAYTGFGISTDEFMRYNADFTGLVNFFDNRWQLKSTLEFGLIQAPADTYIARVYRYFLGGESLRGFDIAGVGSRNILFPTYALGGLWKLNGTTQLNFPIFIPDEYQVKGFVFMDYGVLGRPPAEENNFYGIPSEIDESIRTAAGVGVYWNTPMGPMNFSWGWPITKKPYDREQRFLLSFETQF
ncbi:MAG: outer membrane protein assembly factor BamA [Rickettsiales bacterium]|jgi:outer membrane protein insertion porin family|nr:outer membrane protein assembly factor BamA [Rickettsiales bacterium]